jgi:hypothetical protein
LPTQVQPLVPSYDGAGLAGVLPSVVHSLGVAGPPGPFPLPPARRAVVVLVDGLGLELLRSRSGHAPFLRSLLAGSPSLTSGFPSTTATSMGTFGTGLPPGAHGLVGYEVLIPGEDRLLNELSWEDGPDPFVWQPSETVFQRAEAAGVAVTRVGPHYFDGSGLTNAALRGGGFRAARGLEAAVDTTLAAVRETPRSLVYLSWGDLDKVGHVHGCRSWQWGDELEQIDAQLARLSEALPTDTSLTITADHGMVDAPHALRIDLAHDEELAAGIRHVAGEFRGLQLHCEDGAAADVMQTWSDRVGERAWIRSRDEAIDQGWFGPVTQRVRPRIGEIIVAMRENFAIVDSRSARPQLLSLLGLHGSLTPDELAIPMLHRMANSQATGR